MFHWRNIQKIMFKICFTSETFNKFCLRFRVCEVKYRMNTLSNPNKNVYLKLAWRDLQNDVKIKKNIFKLVNFF